MSLSARRAWIEMLKIGLMLALSLVALRKESVDRHCVKLLLPLMMLLSLSARRAWIEMIHPRLCNAKLRVALRKESVDRNF